MKALIVRVGVLFLVVCVGSGAIGCTDRAPEEPEPVSFRRTGVTPSGDRHESWTLTLDVVASREPSEDEVLQEARSQAKSYMELENLERLQMDVYTEDGRRVATATTALTEEGAEQTGTPVGEPQIEMD